MAGDSVVKAKLKGAQKAAIFLLMMGEEYTAEIFRGMEPEEITMIVTHMSEAKYVAPDMVKQLMEEFVDSIEGGGELVVGGESFLKNVMDRALGKDKARAISKELEKSKTNVPFSYFDNISNNMIVNIIKGEHPQTIALILACLKPDTAAEILAELPEQIQADVAMRIVQMDRVPTEIIQEVDQVLQKEVMSLGDSGTREMNGLMTLANIFNEVDRNSEEQIMSRIEEENGEMAEEIRQLMFVFEDLIKVDDRGFREILKQVDKHDLAVALRTASDELKEKIFSNMSERARDMLREDTEVLGPLRLSEVEKAQQKILGVARQLESEGKLILGKGKEDVFV
ncbi:MAG: flagellar motor switch protein FliG [Desulfobacterales bacterium]|nr:flagellar motor switch protein FliG [Desulfobacterales bacterium]